MIVPTLRLLNDAYDGGYAIGAFNVYNLEGARAVVAAAEAEYSPALLQIHPSALRHGGLPLVALCIAAAREGRVPVAVHLDHSVERDDIEIALAHGVTSVMADGSHLSYDDNVAFTREMAAMAHLHEVAVEAELGRLSGTEDGLTVPDYEAKLTDPDQAAHFVASTGVDMLAVCIGNVHGHYDHEPVLDMERLAAIRRTVSVPLVIHGTSGIPDTAVQHMIDLGVSKFNVNTEVRDAYLRELKRIQHLGSDLDLLGIMTHVMAAMQAVVANKLRLFGSAGRSSRILR